MTDRATLLALAERCEKATGPDRDLDCGVGRLSGASQEQPNGTWMTYHEDGFSHSLHPPAYTASLDAAMTLAGNNEAFWLLHEAVERLRIHLLPADPYPTNEAQRGYLARYFTAAALRAQAAMVGEPS